MHILSKLILVNNFHSDVFNIDLEDKHLSNETLFEQESSKDQIRVSINKLAR